MNYRIFIRYFLFMILASIACRLQTSSAVPTNPPMAPTVTAPTASVPDLTIEQLKNTQYQLGARDDHAVVQLTDGKYQHGTDASTLDYAYVSLTDFLSFGDLTGDGFNEAAAMVFENYGGTGDFGFVAIFTNVNGLPVFLTSTMLDDRPKVNSIMIKNGEVYLDAVVHGPQDPGCCPALPTTRKYALVKNKLFMTNFASSTADGKQRTIEIKSPADGSAVTGSLQLSGDVSVAPFENNLSYVLYDEASNQLAAGPVTITATTQGGPGTFSVPISLTGIPSGTTIYLEVRDLSAADGSLLGMDSVKLLTK